MLLQFRRLLRWLPEPEGKLTITIALHLREFSTVFPGRTALKLMDNCDVPDVLLVALRVSVPLGGIGQLPEPMEGQI